MKTVVRETILFGKPQSLLLTLLTDWMGLNHSMEKNLFYSKSTVLNANHIKKMPSH